MGRLSSGILNEYRDAVARLVEDHDVRVDDRETLRYADYLLRREIMVHRIKVTTRSGALIAAKDFKDTDDDILFNVMTAWLRRLESELKHWR